MAHCFLGGDEVSPRVTDYLGLGLTLTLTLKSQKLGLGLGLELKVPNIRVRVTLDASRDCGRVMDHGRGLP